MMRTSTMVILLTVQALQALQCGAWTLDTSGSKNMMDASKDNTVLGAIAEMDIKVVATLSETVTIVGSRQWVNNASRDAPPAPIPSAMADSFCVAVAVNINAIAATNQTAVDIMHWSNASKSLDLQLRYLVSIENWVMLQVHAQVGDGAAPAVHLLGSPFGVQTGPVNDDVAFLWLTVWLHNSVELDQHEIHVWQLQPTEKAWTPVCNYASLAIKHNAAQCRSLVWSEAVFTVHNVTAASVPDSSTCISTAVASAALAPVLPASLTAMQLMWSKWQISVASVFLDGPSLSSPSSTKARLWRSLSQFTVGHAFTFTDRLLQGRTWAQQVCVCRPLLCTLDVDKPACMAANISTALFVFYNTTSNCANSTCYFIDSMYAMLTGDVRFFGYVAENGATYRGRPTDDYMTDLQASFEASTRGTQSSRYQCGEKPAADGRRLPRFLFNHRACPELNVMLHAIDGFGDS